MTRLEQLFYGFDFGVMPLMLPGASVKYLAEGSPFIVMGWFLLLDLAVGWRSDRYIRRQIDLRMGHYPHQRFPKGASSS